MPTLSDVELLRVWRAHLLSGATAAVAVPAIILGAAVAVGLAGGGLHGIGSLGQALTGPALPDVRPVALSGGGSEDSAQLLARSLPAAGTGGGPGAGSGSGGSGAAGPGDTAGPGGTAGPGDATGPGDTAGPGGRPPQAPPTSPPTPAPTAGPSPTPTPTPRPVRQIGDQVTSVTDQVPLAGEPVGRVVDVLVDTVDGLLP